MYTKLLLLLLLPLSLLTSVTPAQVNGYLHMVEDIPVLHLWGSNTEMGYAYGTLKGSEIVWLIENELVPNFGGPGNYNAFRPWFQNNFYIPSRFQEMAQGIIDGIADHPDSILYSTLLGRNFDPFDLHIGNSTLDIGTILDLQLSGMGCTSLSAWGGATNADPQLQGGAAMARNWDYSSGSETASRGILIVYSPDDGNKWISIAMTGYIGCISGMNEHGVAIAGNISNHQTVSVTTPDFIPVFYRMAEGLVEPDFDASGTYDMGDFVAAATDTTWNNGVSQIWHGVCIQGLEYNGERGVAVEIQNEQGFAIRTADDDPILAPDHIAVTNHHRILYTPVTCWRYSLMTDSIQTNPNLDLDRFWNMMDCCNQPGGSTTFQTMIFDVENLEVGLAFADSVLEACEKDPIWFNLLNLTEIEDIDPFTSMELHVSPNPFSSNAIVSFELPNSGEVNIQVFDLSGRMIDQTRDCMLEAGNHTFDIDGSQWSTGVYLIRVNAGGFVRSQRCILVR